MAENINDISGKVSLDTTDYKANVSELNRQIKIIESGFQAAAAGMDNWSQSAEGLEARIESLTKITDLQRSKVAALKEQYEAIAAAKGADGKAAQDLEIRINKEQQALNANEKELRKCQGALNDFGKETDQTSKQTEGFAAKLKEIGPKLAEIGGTVGKAAAASIAAVGAAVAATGAAAFKMATDAGEAADELLTLSAKTGISVQALQEYQYAARFVDVELETMTGSLAKLTKSMASNNDAFAGLGVSVRDGSGSLRDAREVFYEVVDALGNMSNETERDAAAMQIFGKSAMELNPLIKAGSEELARLSEEARNLGVVLSDDAVNAAGKFDDVMQKFQATTKALATNIGVAVMPAVEEVVGAIGTIVPKIIEAVKTGNWDEAGAALSEGIGDLVKKATEVLPGLAEAAGKIITTLVEAIAKAIPGVLPELIQVTVDVLDSLVKTLIDNAPLLVKAVVDGVKSIVAGVLDMLPQILELGLVIIAELAKGIGDALPVLVPAVIATVDKLVMTLLDNLPMLADAAIQLMMGFVDAIVASAPEITKVIIKFIPEMIKAGVELFIALVDAIPEALVTIVAALPEIIVGITEGLMEALPEIVNAGVQLFVALIQALPEIIRQIVKIIPDIITAIVQALVKATPDIIKAGVELFVALVKALPTIIIEIVKAVPEIIKAIVQGLAQGVSQMVQVGKDLIGGVWQGIKDSALWLYNQVKGFFSNLISQIKKLFGISSPSKVMADEIGRNLALGIGEGFTDNLDVVAVQIQKALKDKTSGMGANLNLNVNGQAGQAAAASVNTTNIQYTFNSPKAIGAREVQQQMTLAEQRLALIGG